MTHNHLAELRAIIEKGLADLAVPQTPVKLYEPMRYILALGGKRVRPTLTLLTAEMYGKSAESVLNQALAVEIFHNFTLVHDDIMDRADVRRNTPTVHKKWDDNVAILSGDGMMVVAYQYLAKAAPDKVSALFEVFSKTALEVCEGQQMDMDLAHAESVLMSDYIEMIRLKTAVLLTCSMQLGAIASGANQADLELIQAFAENIGLAFQIKDDLLDAFGNQADFGKKIGGDIIEGKRTWLTVKSLEIATEVQKQELLQAYINDNLDERVDTVLMIYNQLQIQEKAETEIERYTQIALDALEHISTSHESKTPLRQLVAYLMGRVN